MSNDNELITAPAQVTPEFNIGDVVIYQGKHSVNGHGATMRTALVGTVATIEIERTLNTLKISYRLNINDERRTDYTFNENELQPYNGKVNI